MRFLWNVLKLVLTLAALGGVAAAAFLLALQYATTKETVVVPELVGLDQSAAARELGDRRLFIQIESEDRNVFDERVPAGHVLRQDPPAGTRLKQERRVRVTMSLGPRSVYVPRVVGEPLNAAQIKIQQAGLKVGAIAYSASSSSAENLVLDQEPRTLAHGAEGVVSLLVSSGAVPPAVVMPDLTGRNGMKTRAWFELKGFRVTVSSERYEGLPEGTVVRQKPLAGYPLRLGDSVWLWTSTSSAGRN